MKIRISCVIFQDIKAWPVVDPLPSYGHGRDAAGGRYISLIFGTNLTDVVITGMKVLLFLLHFVSPYIYGGIGGYDYGDCDAFYVACISGANGTIDGQGVLWWQQFHKKKLKYTRPYLIEIMHSDNIQISNLTFLNSPSWNVHPVYSRYSY